MTGASPKILLIGVRPEDRAEVRRSLLSGSDRDVRFLEAGSWEAARPLCQDVDCVILDDGPPDLCARRVLEELRAAGGLTPRPVVVLTAEPAREASGLLRAGATDYVGKRWMNPESLARAVENAVERFALLRERHEAAEAIRRQEERYRLLVEQAVDGIFVASRDGRYVDVNPAGCQMLGMTREEVLASTFTDVLDQQEYHRLPATIAEFADGEVHRTEWRFRRKDGSTFVGELAGRELPDGRLQGVVRDITERKRVEDALRDSEGRFHAMADAAPAMLWVTEPDGSCSFISSGWQDYTGQARAEALGFGWLEAVHPDDREPSERTFRSANATREAFSLDHRLRAADGGYRWVIDSGRPRLDEGGRFLGFVGAVIDVHDHRRAEEALRSQRELFEIVVRRMPASVCVIRGSDLRLQIVNPAYQAIAPGKVMVGRTLDELWPETGRDFAAICRKVLETGEPHQAVDEPFEIRRTPDGPLEAAYFTWSLHRVRLPGEDGSGLLLTAWETTARRKTEEGLRAAHDTFRHLVEHSPFGVYVVDADFRLVQVSSGAQKVFENVRPLLGRDFAEVLRTIWPEDFAEEAIGRFRHTLETGEPFHSPSSVERRQDIDELESYDWKIERIALPDGRPGVVCHFYDLSERNRYEAALQESERRFRSTFENAAVGIAHVALDGRWLRVNDRICEITGYSREELLRMTVMQVSHPDDVEGERTHARNLLAGDIDTYSTEKRYIREDGSEVPVEVTVSLARDRDGDPLYSIRVIQDIAERKRAEDALRESEERFRTLADNISQLAWMADEAGRLFWYNRRWYEYTGTNLEEMQGWGWTKVHHPDHVDRVVERLQRSWDTGEPWEDTFPLRGRDGEYRWFLSRALPIRDARGRVVRWFGTNTDITERRALEESLREQDRRKDEFLAMLAHELRNPLAPICNAVQILRLSGPKDPVLDATRQIIERQANHLVRLVDDLLEVSRVSRGKIQLQQAAIDLAAVVRHAVETSRPLMDARRHELAVSLPAGPVHVHGDFTRLAQVVSNLLNNAAKYTDEGGKIGLTVERGSPEEDGAPSVIVRVRDNGRGMDPQTLDSLFDLFYQADRNLDRSDGGLGIGLSLVKTLVEMHGGRVKAHSPGRGRGSEFEIRLPALPETAADRAEHAAAPPDRAAAATRILVVDDNRDSVESMARLIRLDGHEVFTADDGRKAVEVALRERPAVVLMDIGLPHLDGYRACRAIRDGGLTHALIVAVTGYGQEEDRERSRLADFDAHLVKPVDFEEVRRLLAGVPADPGRPGRHRAPRSG